MKITTKAHFLPIVHPAMISSFSNLPPDSVITRPGTSYAGNMLLWHAGNVINKSKLTVLKYSSSQVYRLRIAQVAIRMFTTTCSGRIARSAIQKNLFRRSRNQRSSTIPLQGFRWRGNISLWHVQAVTNQPLSRQTNTISVLTAMQTTMIRSSSIRVVHQIAPIVIRPLDLTGLSLPLKGITGLFLS